MRPAIAFVALALTACGAMHDAHVKLIEDGRKAHTSVASLVTPKQIQTCASKIAEMKGTFGNTVLQLTHAPTEDARLTCHAYYSNFPPTVPTAYFSAPAKLVEGFGGMPMSADDRLYWCAFQLENGSVTLAKTGIGLKASGLVSDNPITAGMAKSGCSKTSG